MRLSTVLEDDERMDLVSRNARKVPQSMGILILTHGSTIELIQFPNHASCWTHGIRCEPTVQIPA